jgi:hypothetical protein
MKQPQEQIIHSSPTFPTMQCVGCDSPFKMLYLRNPVCSGFIPPDIRFGQIPTGCIGSIGDCVCTCVHQPTHQASSCQRNPNRRKEPPIHLCPSLSLCFSCLSVLGFKDLLFFCFFLFFLAFSIEPDFAQSNRF